MIDIQPITAENLPDAVRLCLTGKSLADRPSAFTREVETECSRCKLGLVRERQMSGGAAFAAYHDGMLVGYAELHTIADAVAPLDGKEGHVLQCLRVPEEPLREIVERALIDHAFAQLGARGGIAVLARGKDWAPYGFRQVSLSCAERITDDRALWWRGNGEPPKILEPQRDFALIEGKVRVDLFTSERCAWDIYVCDLVRKVAESMPSVVLFETECMDRRTVRETGVVSAVAVNARYMAWFPPHKVPDEDDIRREFELAL